MPKKTYEKDPDTLLETGLWARESTKGNKYYSALVEINGVNYWVNLFRVDSSNPKAPDLSLMIKKAGEKKESKKSAKKDEDDIPF